MSDWADTHGTIIVADTPSPILVGLTRRQSIQVDSTESDWIVVIIVVVVVPVVVQGVGIGGHSQNIMGCGVSLGLWSSGNSSGLQ